MNMGIEEQLYQELIEKMKTYHPTKDFDMVEKAYRLAVDAHKDQKRKSGEPYIIHPLKVAYILAELELDRETIIAGILHDVIEDTVYSYEDISRLFSEEIAILVDGVTKLGKLSYSTKEEIQAENYRKMFLAMAKDIRVQQMGTSKSIYDEPQNAFVADFIGDSNIIDGIMKADRLVQIQGVPIPCVDTGFGKDELVDVVIRPEDLEITAPETGYLTGRVISVIFKGAYYEIKVRAGAYDWSIQDVNPAPVGSMVGLSILPDNIQIMHKPHSEDAQAVREEE